MTLDHKFADGVREQLVSTASGTSPLAARTRQTRRAMGIAAVAAAGVVLSAGALVVSAFVPGQHVVSPLGEPVSENHVGSATIQLGERPEGANAARVVITCTGPGTFVIDHMSEVSTMECADVDEFTPIEDGRLLAPVGNTMTLAALGIASGESTFDVDVSEGSPWTVVVSWVKTVTTDWGVNANGQTYGTPNENGQPDLIAVQATNGKVGYSYWSDFMTHGDQGDTFPVYEPDGITVIGEFFIGNS